MVRIYAEILAARGHHVEIVSCPEPRERLRRRVKRALTGGGFAPAPRTVPNQLEGTPIPHRVVRRHERPEVDEVPDADVVVATWWETAEWAVKLPASKGRPLFFVQHDERVFTEMDSSRRSRVEDTWRLGMPAVVVADWIAKEMVAHGADPARITRVPNAVDAHRFQAPPRGKQPAPTVGLMFNWIHFKGVDVAVDAIRIARESVPNLVVKAFGHAELRHCPFDPPAGMEYVSSPPQERIPGIYASCDAWLFGSRCEGFGLPILEAMACRTPVIGTPAGAAPELLGPGPNTDDAPAGVLVPMENPAAMAEAIVNVVRLEEAAWRALSDRAHNVATGYTWEQAADLFEAQLRAAATA